MIRKILSILSLIGLLLSVGLWGSSASDRSVHIGIYRFLFLRDGLIGYGHLTDHEAIDITHQQILVASDGIDRTHEEMSLNVDPQADERFIDNVEKDRWWFHRIPASFVPAGEGWLPDLYRFSLGRHYGSGHILFLPLRTAVVVFALMLSWSWYVPLHRRYKRKKLGLCLKCGYDLRASKERCPECGSPFQES